jgi:hypothetical protein
MLEQSLRLPVPLINKKQKTTSTNLLITDDD